MNNQKREHNLPTRRQLIQRVRNHVQLLQKIGKHDWADFLTISADSVFKPDKTRTAIKALNLNIDQAHDPIQFGLWVMLAESYNKSRL